MSFHQLKLQKDALRSLRNVPLSTNEASQPLPTNINSTDAALNCAKPFAKDAIGRNEDDPADLSELEYGEESWTTMSEVDSQYSRSSNSMRFASLELSRITDSDDSDNDDVDEGQPVPMASRIPKQRLLPPVGIISTPTGILNTKGFDHHYQHHNSITSGRIIGGIRLISPREVFEDNSDASPPRPQTQSSENGQERVKEAEAQVLQAREELAMVTKHLEELQEKHEIKVGELQDQLASMKLKEHKQDFDQSTVAGVKFDDDGNKVVKDEDIHLEQPVSTIDMEICNVAVVDSEYEDQLEIAQKQKEVAESKLDDAIKKLQMVESEKQQLAEESRELQIKLESTRKKVHFAEDQNSILEFRVDEYKTKWKDSLEKTQQIESKLVTTRCDLENVVRQAELIQESCELAVTNAVNDAAKERSLREEHARKEHRVVEQLSAQCHKNDQLQKYQLGLEETVKSLQQERFGLQQKLEKTTSRRNYVEADLSEANDECHRLTSELDNFRASMELLKSDHDQKQKNLQALLDSQLEELGTSVAILAEKDELNEERLTEHETEASKLKTDAKISQLKGEEHIRVEQRLLSDLKESHGTAHQQNEASCLKLEQYRKSMDVLVVQNELNKKMLSERKVEMLKLKKDSETAKLELKAKHNQEQQELEKVEKQLLSKLKVSREKANEEKELSDSKMEELRKEIDALVTKDELNQKMLLEHKAEILKLNVDSEAAKMAAQLKYKREQRKLGEEKQQLASELKETHKNAQEQKQSSDSEIDNFRKSIDDLIAKDELELAALRKSIDALDFKDELNQKMLSEREKEELRLKASSKAVIVEARAKYEEEQWKSVAVEQQLESELKNSNSKARALQLEKDTLEEKILTLKKEQGRLNEALAEANDRWKAAEESVKRLCEEKRLLSADLTASRYSVLRLESEQSRSLVERNAMVECHKLELANQKSVLSSSREIKLMLEKELDVVRSIQMDLKQEKADLESRLQSEGEVHDNLVEAHEASVQKFQARIEDIQAENSCLVENSLDFESAQSDLKRRLGKLREEYEILKQTHHETKLELDSKSKEQEDFSRASSERYKLFDTERNDFQIKIESLHSKELELEEKLRDLVDRLEVSNSKLEKKEKYKIEMDHLLWQERERVNELEDENEDLMRKNTSISVELARSLVEFEKKTMAAKAKSLEIEEECSNLKADISLTMAAKETLSWKQKAVKQELTRLQEEHFKSKEKISKLLLIQNESEISSERQIAQLMDMEKRLKMEKENSNKIRVELEETLNVTMASWDDCKSALLEKENESRKLESELAKVIAIVQDLKQQQALLLVEKVAAANEKNSMIALHSMIIDDYGVSAASLKEELGVIRANMRTTKREKEDLQKRTEELDSEKSILKQQCDATMSVLNKARRQLEVAKEEKSLLQSILKDQSRFTESLLWENEKHQESLETSENEIDELRSKFATTESSVDGLNARIEKLQNEKKNLEEEIRNYGKREQALISDLRFIKEDNSFLRESKVTLILENKNFVDCLETAKSKIACENKGIMSELQSLKEQRMVLMQQCDIADKRSFEFSRACNRIEELETMEKQLKEEIEHGESAKADLVAEKVESENVSKSIISKLREENDRLGKEQELLRENVAHLEAEKIEWKNTVQSRMYEFENDNGRLTTNLKDANAKFSALENEVHRITKDNSSLVASLVEAREMIVTLSTEVDGATSQNIFLKETQGSITNLQSEGDAVMKEISSLKTDLKEANTIANLQIEADAATKERSSLNVNLKESNESIATIHIEAEAAVKRNSVAVATLEKDLKEANASIDTLNVEATGVVEKNSSLNSNLNEAKETIATLYSEAAKATKENSFLDANLKEAKKCIDKLDAATIEAAKEFSSLNTNLNEANESIVTLHIAAVESAKKSSVIATLKEDLQEENVTMNTLQTETDKAAMKNYRLIANLKGNLKKAKGTIATLQTEIDVVANENSCLIANLKSNLKEAKGAIVTLQTEATEAAKEKSRLIVNLKCNLKEEKGTIASLQATSDVIAKENSCLIANLKGDLKEAKGTIATLKKKVDVGVKKNFCLIAILEEDLKEAKGTIATLETKLDDALARDLECADIMKELRSEVATLEEMMRGIEVDRNRLRDEMESVKENFIRLKEESKNSTVLRSVSDHTIRSLQNELANEKKKTESIMGKNNLVSREKNELKFRLKEAEDILTKEVDANKLRDECVHQEHELETESLPQQMEKANLCGTHLREAVVCLEFETKAERSRSANQEYLRSVDEAKIKRLESDLEEQTKKTKKLAKLLKRTITSVTRVSQMKMNVDLCSYDTSANEYRKMPGKVEYSGGVVNSKPHGAGVMKFDCGDMYLGTFDNGT